MTKKERRDGDRRPAERRDNQPDEEQRRQPGEPERQEGDSLTALKAILGKVAALLPNLKLKPDESVSVVEQLYGSVLEMDLKLAGETDDKRKASVLAHIKNTKVSRVNGKLVVEFPKGTQPKPQTADNGKATSAKPDSSKAKTPAAQKPPAEQEPPAAKEQADKPTPEEPKTEEPKAEEPETED